VTWATVIGEIYLTLALFLGGVDCEGIVGNGKEIEERRHVV
jgi:hypothetical protein